MLFFGGAFFGTLPDLDIVFFPFLDDVQQLYWHRGESHSIFFVLIDGALLGALLWRVIWNSRFSFSLGNLFIIDPLYTGPLLLGIIAAAFSRSGYAKGGRMGKNVVQVSFQQLL